MTVACELEKAGLKIPLLIGGATTSKMHTAVKISPRYSGPTIYVLDASRSVPVAQSLVDAVRAGELWEDTKETYAEMREEFFAGLADQKFLSLDKARQRRLQLDFGSPQHAPCVPRKLGVTVMADVAIADVLPYIDWNPFFQASTQCSASA